MYLKSTLCKLMLCVQLLELPHPMVYLKPLINTKH